MNNKYSIPALLLIIVTFITLSYSAVLTKSQTSDEAVHLTAGYEHMYNHDFRLNPDKPPLAKLVAALPLGMLNLKDAHDMKSYQVADVWLYSFAFMYMMNSEKAAQMLDASRAAMLIFGIIIIIFLYAWGKRLYGPVAGLIAPLLFSLSPNMLGHAPLVATDMAYTAFAFVAIYNIWRLINTGKFTYLLFAGLSAGLAMSSKHAGIMIIPLVTVLLLFMIAKSEAFINNVESLMTAENKKIRSGIIIVGLLIAGTFYDERFLWINRFVFSGLLIILVLTLFSYLDKEKKYSLLEYSKRIRSYFLSVTFAWVVFFVIALFTTTLLYFDYKSSFLSGDIFRSFHNILNVIHRAGTGNAWTFLNGEHSPEGFKLYYPFLILAKTSLSVLLLLVLSLFVAMKDAKKRGAILSFFAVPLLIVIMVTYFNKAQIGVRHVFLIYPFLFLACTSVIVYIFERFGKKAGITFTAIILSAQLLVTIGHYPNYISYTNGLLFPKDKAYEHITDSNIDWGQNVKPLVKYLESQGSPQIRTYMYYQGQLPLNGYTNYIPVDPLEITQDFKGLLVIDVQQYNLYPGDLKWLKTNRKPDTIIGNSILIYNIK